MKEESRSDVKKEAGDTINVMMRLQSRDAYSFGLQLMDLLFTKEELSSSLLFISKKSEKPGLNPERVNKLLYFYMLAMGPTGT